jgi:hypothetical protein
MLDGMPTTAESFAKAENLYAADLEDRKQIFKEILPEEEFIDRRINIAQLIEPETESDNDEELKFIDEYDKEGKLIKSTSNVKSRKNSRSVSR